MSELQIISRKEMFDFWDDLPPVRSIDADHFSEILKPIRRRILEILSEGIRDNHPTKSLVSTRYALSANEIRNKLESGTSDSDKISISYQNIYFHLKKLEDLEVIKLVGILVNGKRTTSYFGRTAKTFISSDQDELGYASIVRDEEFYKFIKNIEHQASEDTIKSTLQGVELINRPNYPQYQRWLQTHKDQLHGLKIDYRKLMELYYLIKNIDLEFLDNLKKLGLLLRIT